MSNLLIKNGLGTDGFLKATGAGSDVDPHIPEHLETNSAAVVTKLTSIDDKAPALGQALAAASVPVVLSVAQMTTLTPPAAISGFATATNQTSELTLIGAVTETVPASDTASSGLNGRLQRLAQRLTSLIALLPTTLGQKAKSASLAVTLASDQDALPITDNAGSLTVDGTVAATQSGTWTVQPGNTANTTAWKVDGSAVTQPVSGTIAVTGVATAANQATLLARLPAALGGTISANSLPVSLSSDGPFAVATGSVTETAPASDTASSGLNGRAQRIAQRITSLIALFPAALTGSGNFKTAVNEITIPTAIFSGQSNVATAGTQVALASSQAILSGVTIKAKIANTGSIFVGPTGVSSSNGYTLAAGDSVFIEVANLATVFLNSSVNGEGVSFAAS